VIRFTGLFSTCFLALTLFGNSAAGQAMVESGLATGAAASATTPARGLKNGMTGMFDRLDKTLKSAQDETDSKRPSSSVIRLDAPVTAESKTAVIANPAQAPLSDLPPALPSPSYEDPATIQAGIGYQELLRRFGPPALEFIDGPNRKVMSYLKKGGAAQVEFRGGKVTSAERPNL
jgi:hypothetical protein